MDNLVNLLTYKIQSSYKRDYKGKIHNLQSKFTYKKRTTVGSFQNPKTIAKQINFQYDWHLLSKYLSGV